MYFGKIHTLINALKNCSINNTVTAIDALSFNADFPSYTKKLPRSVHFYAAIDATGKKVKEVIGAELVRTRGNMLIIKFKKGDVRIEFQK